MQIEQRALPRALLSGCGQNEHALWPRVGETVPGAHGVGSKVPSPQKWPSGHWSLHERSVRLRERPKEPAAQG